jgi:plasmid stabilization system protein ParE
LKFRISVAPRAAQQIRTAAKWWIANRTAAPAMLSDELEAAYALIQELPSAGEAVPHSRLHRLRRVLLGLTQYYLYYAVLEDERTIRILALWHEQRQASTFVKCGGSAVPACRAIVDRMSDFTVDVERETDGRWIGEVTVKRVVAERPLWSDGLSARRRPG